MKILLPPLLRSDHVRSLLGVASCFTRARRASEGRSMYHPFATFACQHFASRDASPLLARRRTGLPPGPSPQPQRGEIQQPGASAPGEETTSRVALKGRKMYGMVEQLFQPQRIFARKTHYRNSVITH